MHYFNKIIKFLKSVSKFFLFVMALLLALFLYLRYQIKYPSTNDATLQANIIAISSRVSGTINTINVVNNQYVKQGQLIFSLDSTPFYLAVAEAKANLIANNNGIAASEAGIAAATAKLKQLQLRADLANRELLRYQTLLKTNSVSRDQFDQIENTWREDDALLQQQQHILVEAQDNLSILQANQKKLAAKLELAELNLSWTKVTAPKNGYIANFKLQIGDPILPLTPLFGLIESNSFWVTGNFLETELRKIRSGNPANIWLLMYPDKRFKGVVQSIGFGISSEAQSGNILLPYVQPTIDWLRLAQRFPVKVLFVNPDPNYPLRVGANARISIDTTKP